MQWNQQKIFFAIVALAILWLPLTHAEETETVLHWKKWGYASGSTLKKQTGGNPLVITTLFPMIWSSMSMYWTQSFSRNNRCQ